MSDLVPRNQGGGISIMTSLASGIPRPGALCPVYPELTFLPISCQMHDANLDPDVSPLSLSHVGCITVTIIN